jgi:hypothetical protein
MKLTGKAVIAVVTLSLMLVGATALVFGTEASDEEKLSPAAPGEVFARTAEILSVSEEELLAALNRAYVELTTERIDKLVEEGWLGEKRAELMKERINELSAVEKAKTLRFFACNRGPAGGRFGMRAKPGILPGRPRR